VAMVACGFREAVDAKRLAYVEVLPDEQQAATVCFLAGAVSWSNSQGITCQ